MIIKLIHTQLKSSKSHKQAVYIRQTVPGIGSGLAETSRENHWKTLVGNGTA